MFTVFPDTSTPKLNHVSLASFGDNTMPASSISSIAFAKDTAQRLRSCSTGFSFDAWWLSMGQELWCYIDPFKWFGDVWGENKKIHRTPSIRIGYQPWNLLSNPPNHYFDVLGFESRSKLAKIISAKGIAIWRREESAWQVKPRTNKITE